ncbi:hypothetical protein Tco_0260291 [Tanacetum coccineum]
MMIEPEVEVLRARAEAAEKLAEALHASLGAAQMDIRDLIESRMTDRLEMIIAQRVVSAIETIAIYEAKTRVTRDSRNQVGTSRIQGFASDAIKSEERRRYGLL